MRGKKEKQLDAVAKALADGVTVSEASKKFKVSRATIYAWKAELEKLASNG